MVDEPEELLKLAADSLKKSIDFAVRQMNARKVRGEAKLRWSRTLTKQVEALVKVAEAQEKLKGKSGADLDLSSYLSVVKEKLPREYTTRKFVKIVDKARAGGLRYERIRVR